MKIMQEALYLSNELYILLSLEKKMPVNLACSWMYRNSQKARTRSPVVQFLTERPFFCL